MSGRKPPTIQSLATSWSKKADTQRSSKEALIEALEGYLHKFVRIRRNGHAVWVSARKVGEKEWEYEGYTPLKYNQRPWGQMYPAAEGMVVGYELDEDHGAYVYLVIAVPNDPKQYRFDARYCKIEPLEILVPVGAKLTPAGVGGEGGLPLAATG